MRPPYRVMAFPKGSSNAYINQFTSALEGAGLQVSDYEHRDAWRSRDFDVLHFHWPESYVKASTFWGALKRHLRFALLLLYLRVRGKRIAWTIHNLEPHEAGHWLGRRLFALYFPLACSHIVALSEHGLRAARERFPSLAGKPSIVIRHGHYRAVYTVPSEKKQCRRLLGLPEDSFTYLFFGQVRRYKNVPALIEQFNRIESSDVQLVVAGAVKEQSLEKKLCSLAETSRVKLDLRFIPDSELGLFYGAADVVVIPFSSVLNSGSVILALSLERPVIAPEMGALCDVRDHVGHEWLRLYKGDLTVEMLRDARRDIPNLRQAPDLSAFDWDDVGENMISLYAR